jgi:hypothetical protein
MTPLYVMLPKALRRWDEHFPKIRINFAESLPGGPMFTFTLLSRWSLPESALVTSRALPFPAMSAGNLVSRCPESWS